jgi:uncharacterized DUF497 family protein
MLDLSKVKNFQWDKGNEDKNWSKHSVSNQECEEIFFDRDKKFLEDMLHSGKEKRYIIIGRTKKQRILFIAFTVRRSKIRAISARDLNKRELNLYKK